MTSFEADGEALEKAVHWVIPERRMPVDARWKDSVNKQTDRQESICPKKAAVSRIVCLKSEDLSFESFDADIWEIKESSSGEFDINVSWLEYLKLRSSTRAVALERRASTHVPGF